MDVYNIYNECVNGNNDCVNGVLQLVFFIYF